MDAHSTQFLFYFVFIISSTVKWNSVFGFVTGLVYPDTFTWILLLLFPHTQATYNSFIFHKQHCMCLCVSSVVVLFWNYPEEEMGTKPAFTNWIMYTSSSFIFTYLAQAWLFKMPLNHITIFCIILQFDHNLIPEKLKLLSHGECFVQFYGSGLSQNFILVQDEEISGWISADMARQCLNCVLNRSVHVRYGVSSQPCAS